jgi:hypothetical protein
MAGCDWPAAWLLAAVAVFKSESHRPPPRSPFKPHWQSLGDWQASDPGRSGRRTLRSPRAALCSAAAVSRFSLSHLMVLPVSATQAVSVTVDGHVVELAPARPH